MGPIDLSFDVTQALPAEVTQGQPVRIAAWLFFPDDPALLGARPTAMTLTSGGSYDKRYHHAVVPGHPGYSAAEHLAALGNVVLLCDHLGSGESTRAPDQRLATRHVVAAANHAAVTQFYERLAKGDLHPALLALPNVLRVGGGHSMGGMMTTVQQAAHRTWDAIMIMGYTAQGVHMTRSGQKLRASQFIPATPGPDYPVNDRAAQRENFHWPDVPAEVIAADDKLSVPTPSSIGLDSIRDAIIVPDAARIDVPIYMGLGEQDVSPDPHSEPHFFPKCPDFTLHILPRSAHCQSFAGTRHRFWDRMHGWTRGLVVA